MFYPALMGSKIPFKIQKKLGRGSPAHKSPIGEG
ncbi:spermidine/putrescine ABC transporter ATP-binding protein [Bacillus cereus]|nr:spermidine/putrescine ABC transporter ATP-binding protein [Bacillus cereus]